MITGEIRTVLQDLCEVVKDLNNDTKDQLVKKKVSKKLKDVELQINFLN